MDTGSPNAVGTDNLVVLKITTSSVGNDSLSASFWTVGVDTLTSAEPTNWDVSTTIDSSLLASGINIRFDDGFSNLDVSFDEIRIGDSFAAVTVPEPSSLLAFGALVLALGFGHRRRMRAG